MDTMEKVEKLRERADVSYEDAKKALEENNWDLLEAMVSLEKQGKTKGPAKESYSTRYEEQEQYVSVQDKVNAQKEDDGENVFKKSGRLIGTLIRKGRENYFHIRRKGEEILCIPVLALVVVLFFWWEVLVPALFIGLFFDFQYSFKGKDDLSGVNRAMEEAEKFAGKVKDECDKM